MERGNYLCYDGYNSMTKKTRLIILLICMVCFLLVAPYIILYSLGYRVDVMHFKILATGGIYVRTYPAADQVIIDSKDFEKPGLFSNSIFVQNLLPKEHSILIQKNGYYGYAKILPVVGKEVTKLENVFLFKKNIQFTLLANSTKSPFLAANQPNQFVIKNNNLYYASTTQNGNLTAIQKATPIIKNLVAFTLSNNTIIWLGTDGILYQSDGEGKNPVKMILLPLTINKNGFYSIANANDNTFVDNNGALLTLNEKTNTLDNFASQIQGEKISPDDNNIIYFSGSQIYIASLLGNGYSKTLLYQSAGTITNEQWINSNYIIFTAGNNIIISEIDTRGNINTITLPTQLSLSDGTTITDTAPQIFFNQSEKKLYILTKGQVLVSEQLIP